MKITKKQSDELNDWIVSFVDEIDYGFRDTGKAIAYIGWFWRNVDFTYPIWLGHIKYSGGMYEGPADFIGFMENNKWGYESFKITSEQQVKIIEKLVDIKKDSKLDSKKLAEFNEFLQVLGEKK